MNINLNAPHKTRFGNFEILKIKMLTNFFVLFNMELNGSENFKRLLPLQLWFFFNHFLNILWDRPHKRFLTEITLESLFPCFLQDSGTLVLA